VDYTLFVLACLLLACRYFDPRTSIGVILGTGTNACYVLPVSHFSKWKPEGPSIRHSKAQVN